MSEQTDIDMLLLTFHDIVLDKPLRGKVNTVATVV